jgi:hypothetical protein
VKLKACSDGTALSTVVFLLCKIIKQHRTGFILSRKASDLLFVVLSEGSGLQVIFPL